MILRPSHPAVRLLTVLVVAVAVRLLVAAPFAATEPRGDEAYYLEVAQSIVAGDGHPGSVRPPLQPALMAVGIALGGQRGIQGLQLLLSLALVALVMDAARRRFGGRSALAAGLAAALAPSLAHYAHFYWSEGLNAFLMAAWVWALTLWEQQLEREPSEGPSWRSRGLLALGTSILAWAALTRESWLYFVAPFTLWAIWRVGAERPPLRLAAYRVWFERRRLATAALVLITFATWVTPWMVRNSKLNGEPVSVSTNHWLPIAIGNLLPEDDWIFGENRGKELRRQLPASLSEMEQERRWRIVALEAIVAEQPFWALKKLVRNGGRLVSLHSQTVRFLERRWIRPSPTVGRALLLYDSIGYLVIAIAGLAGLWLTPDPRLKILVAAALLYTAFVHLVANAIPRFHVPLLPLICLYAGPVLSAPLRSWSTAAPWRRWAAIATVALFLGAVGHRGRWALEEAWRVTGGGP